MSPGGLLLTPGAGSNRDNPSLIAIEVDSSARGRCAMPSVASSLSETGSPEMSSGAMASR